MAIGPIWRSRNLTAVPCPAQIRHASDSSRKYQATPAGLDVLSGMTAIAICVCSSLMRPLRKRFDRVHEIVDFVRVRVFLPAPAAGLQRVLARTAILVGRIQRVVERLVSQRL